MLRGPWERLRALRRAVSRDGRRTRPRSVALCRAWYSRAMARVTSPILFTLLLASAPLACGDSGSATETSPTGDSSETGTTDTGTTASTDTTGNTETTAGFEDLDMQPSDFECVLNWDKVRNMRITNKLGYQEEALAVANDPEGGVYPVGTVIQLIPTEAMVKRGPGTNPATNDWEFFYLAVSQAGTGIEARGFEDVENGLGGNCVELSLIHI